MRFMLLQHYADTGPSIGMESMNMPSMDHWSGEDIANHVAGQQALNAELTESGELVDAQGLAGPHEVRYVQASDVTAPVVTDGPFPESKEFLAGYRIVEVDSLDRALEIAAAASAIVGYEGKPVAQPIEVRQILTLDEAQ